MQIDVCDDNDNVKIPVLFFSPSVEDTFLLLHDRSLSVAYITHAWYE